MKSGVPSDRNPTASSNLINQRQMIERADAAIFPPETCLKEQMT
jgi:hypothetical protein